MFGARVEKVHFGLNGLEASRVDDVDFHRRLLVSAGMLNEVLVLPHNLFQDASIPFTQSRFSWTSELSALERHFVRLRAFGDFVGSFGKNRSLQLPFGKHCRLQDPELGEFRVRLSRVLPGKFELRSSPELFFCLGSDVLFPLVFPPLRRQLQVDRCFP